MDDSNPSIFQSNEWTEMGYQKGQPYLLSCLASAAQDS